MAITFATRAVHEAFFFSFDSLSFFPSELTKHREKEEGKAIVENEGREKGRKSWGRKEREKGRKEVKGVHCPREREREKERERERERER